MALVDDVVAAALARHECVLVRASARRVLLLDGSTVIVEGDGAGRFKALSAAAAADDFCARIGLALSDGFEPAHRDPPRAVAFVQPQRAPDATSPTLAARTPSATPRPALDGWLVHGTAARLTIDELDGPDPSQLNAELPADVSFLDVGAANVDDALELLSDGLPPWAKGLGLVSFEAVEDFEASVLEPERLWHQVRSLEALDLRAGSLGSLPGALPLLRALGLWTSAATPELLDSLVASPWPRLTHLELWLDGLDADRIAERLTQAAFPALKHLALHWPADDDVKSALEASLGVPVGRGRVFPRPSAIHVLTEDRHYPLRSSRFNGD